MKFRYLKYLLFVIAALSTTTELTAQQLTANAKALIEDYERNIEKFRQEGQKTRECEYLNKAAMVYWQSSMWDNALEYYSLSLEKNRELGNSNAVKIILNYIGAIYIDLGKFQNAFTAFNEALTISRRGQNKADIASSLINVARSQEGLKHYNEAITLALEALELSTEISNYKMVRTCHGLLADNYKHIGNTEKHIEYFELYSTIDQYLKKEEIKEKDKEVSAMQNQNQQARRTILEKETLLDSTQQELKVKGDSLLRVEELTREQQMAIELLNQEKQIQELQLEQQEAQAQLEATIRKFLIFGVVIVLIFLGIVFKQFKNAKRANIILAAKNDEIARQKAEIQLQKEQVEMKNELIKGSIRYAQTIQNAILPRQNDIDKVFDSFILFRPKDIVSGDFYWFSHINQGQADEKIFVAAIDCTGHGVPGAFMSMIGNRLLNEIVNEKRTFEPADILEQMNNGVRKSLNQSQTDNEDGMDLALCRMQKIDGKIEVVFAGAKRPLLFYNRTANEMQTFKGDRRAIGGVLNKRKESPFESVTFQAQAGDMFFLFSDGIIDQNSPDRKRFGTKKFAEIIEENISKTMNEQGKKLEEALDNFMEGEVQRDDIVVLGLKLLLK